MSAYAKMRKKRDDWKWKTAKTKTGLRYQKKENKRIKGERDKYKRALRKTEKELHELKQQNKPFPVRDKTSLVLLVLQFFVVARIGL